METDERTSSIEPAGVVATACRHRGPGATRGSPSGDRGRDQLAARERQAGPFGVAEGSVVPRKLGNSGSDRLFKKILVMDPSSCARERVPRGRIDENWMTWVGDFLKENATAGNVALVFL